VSISQQSGKLQLDAAKLWGAYPAHDSFKFRKNKNDIPNEKMRDSKKNTEQAETKGKRRKLNSNPSQVYEEIFNKNM